MLFLEEQFDQTPARMRELVRDLMRVLGFEVVEGRPLPWVVRVDPTTVDPRHGHVKGFYVPKMDLVVVKDDEDVLETMAHELCHSLQDEKDFIPIVNGVVTEDYIRNRTEQEARCIQFCHVLGVAKTAAIMRIVGGPEEVSLSQMVRLFRWSRRVARKEAGFDDAPVFMLRSEIRNVLSLLRG